MVELTNETFTPFVSNSDLTVVHFWAAWNRIDDEMRSLLSRIDLAGVSIGRFDTAPEIHHDICKAHAVKNLPFLAIYRHGQLLSSVTGMRQEHVLVDKLKEFMGGEFDIVFECKKTSEDAAAKACEILKIQWPNCIVEPYEPSSRKEVMVYRDQAAVDSWGLLGAVPSNKDLMIQILANDGEFTLVVGDPEIQPAKTLIAQMNEFLKIA